MLYDGKDIEETGLTGQDLIVHRLQKRLRDIESQEESKKNIRHKDSFQTHRRPHRSPSSEDSLHTVSGHNEDRQSTEGKDGRGKHRNRGRKGNNASSSSSANNNPRRKLNPSHPKSHARDLSLSSSDEEDHSFANTKWSSRGRGRGFLMTSSSSSPLENETIGNSQILSLPPGRTRRSFHSRYSSDEGHPVLNVSISRRRNDKILATSVLPQIVSSRGRGGGQERPLSPLGREKTSLLPRPSSSSSSLNENEVFRASRVQRVSRGRGVSPFSSTNGRHANTHPQGMKMLLSSSSSDENNSVVFRSHLHSLARGRGRGGLKHSSYLEPLNSGKVCSSQPQSQFSIHKGPSSVSQGRFDDLSSDEEGGDCYTSRRILRKISDNHNSSSLNTKESRRSNNRIPPPHVGKLNDRDFDDFFSTDSEKPFHQKVQSHYKSNDKKLTDIVFWQKENFVASSPQVDDKCKVFFEKQNEFDGFFPSDDDKLEFPLAEQTEELDDFFPSEEEKISPAVSDELGDFFPSTDGESKTPDIHDNTHLSEESPALPPKNGLIENKFSTDKDSFVITTELSAQGYYHRCYNFKSKVEKVAYFSSEEREAMEKRIEIIKSRSASDKATKVDKPALEAPDTTIGNSISREKDHMPYGIQIPFLNFGEYFQGKDSILLQSCNSFSGIATAMVAILNSSQAFGRILDGIYGSIIRGNHLTRGRRDNYRRDFDSLVRMKIKPRILPDLYSIHFIPVHDGKKMKEDFFIVEIFVDKSIVTEPQTYEVEHEGRFIWRDNSIKKII